MPVNPALETLMLVFSPDEDGVPRDRCLFLGAEPHPALSEWSDIVGWQPLKPKADAWERAGFERIDHLGDRKFPLAIFLPGKSRDETLAGFAIARDALVPGGRLVVCGGTSGPVVEVNLPRLFFKQHEIIGSTMGGYGEWDRAVRFLEQGLPVAVDRELPIGEYPDALAALEAARQVGKIVLHHG